MHAKEIIDNAKAQIKEFIKFELPLLTNKLGFGQEEETFSVCTGDLGKDIYINVEVDNSYLDVEERTMETREIAEIILDGESGEITLADEDGNEWSADDITLEELAEISDAIESAYLKK